MCDVGEILVTKDTGMNNVMNRRLAELLEPDPEAYLHGDLSCDGFWRCDQRGRWYPVTFDDNAMRRVRAELKRRGQGREHLWRIATLLTLPDDLMDWSDDDYEKLLDAPLDIQIRAAVEVLEKAAQAP